MCSRAWRRVYVFALGSDWFIGLSSSVVIGQRDNVGLVYGATKNRTNF